ncbi:hypothetical protein JOL79_00070 [Microbispora sp. RL4-1S]|uniref:Uncharacterized protein n=1 Tax=Microbispora oryzae TaxID=2806554 RepID=A0A941AFQ4_9ACTN|nr:hypothetical protein [Microbispora oryzae]MBP2702191.1 hypothetical protein [Microbispora oryzae]
MNPTDGELVTRARSGDAAAFHELVRRHRPMARPGPGTCAAASSTTRAGHTGTTTRAEPGAAGPGGRHIRPPAPGGEWEPAEIEADVPDDAVFLLFGATLRGPGPVEMRDVRLDAL